MKKLLKSLGIMLLAVTTLINPSFATDSFIVKSLTEVTYGANGAALSQKSFGLDTDGTSLIALKTSFFDGLGRTVVEIDKEGNKIVMEFGQFGDTLQSKYNDSGELTDRTYYAANGLGFTITNLNTMDAAQREKALKVTFNDFYAAYTATVNLTQNESAATDNTHQEMKFQQNMNRLLGNSDINAAAGINCYLTSMPTKDLKELVNTPAGQRILARLMGYGTSANGGTEDATQASSFIASLVKMIKDAPSGVTFSFTPSASGKSTGCIVAVTITNNSGKDFDIKDPNTNKVTTIKAHGGQAEITPPKSEGGYVYDPLVQGNLTQVVQGEDGKFYAVVQADTVDMFDGNGPQAADGATIYVEVDADTAKAMKADLAAGNNGICIAGNVKADEATGQYVMTMNAGGYKQAATAASAGSQWMSENKGFYDNTVAAMAPVWDAAKARGAGSDWKSGWNFLKDVMTGKEKDVPLPANF